MGDKFRYEMEDIFEKKNTGTQWRVAKRYMFSGNSPHYKLVGVDDPEVSINVSQYSLLLDFERDGKSYEYIRDVP